MDKAHRKLLLKNRLAFVKDVEAFDLTGYLYQDGIISENDKEKIEVQATRRDRIEHLLDLLPRKGPKAFEKFCDVLNQLDGYQYLAKLLMPSKYSQDNDAVDAVDASPAKQLTNIELQQHLTPRRGSKPLVDMLNAYPMKSNPRGWCFIINNMHFFNLSDRIGSAVDAHNLKTLFTALGFRVWLLNDADIIDIQEKLQELANKTNHGDCLVVCILSHGLSGKIYGVEGQLITVSEILDILNDGPIATLLKGKPKLFLIQACRNSKVKAQNKNDKTVDSSQVIFTPQASNLEEKRSKGICVSGYDSFIEESKVQTYSDIILAYSTFPGEVSWRHTENGSYFIDSVVEVFTQYSSSEDVLSMLVKVNEKTLEKLSRDGIEQIPAPVFTLTKKLYLYPP